MKSLLRWLLERAEAEGGEEWIRLCLALPSGMVAAEGGGSSSTKVRGGKGFPEATVGLEVFAPEDEMPLQVPGLRGQEDAGTGETCRQARRTGK